MATTGRRIKKATTPPPTFDNSELEADIAAYIELRSNIEDAEKAKKELGSDMLGILESRGVDAKGHAKIKTYSGKAGQVTAVYPEGSPVIDPDRLKQRLGTTMWNKISTRVLDHNKLDAFVKSGEISQRDIAACSTTTAGGTPHVRVTAK